MFLSAAAKADIIGMIKPVVIAERKENGKTLELEVEYELWNYWHSAMSHKWTEVYQFNQSGILTLSYGDGNWAGDKKKYWKHRYQTLGKNRLKDWYYEYGSKTTNYPETKVFLSYIDTVETDNEFEKVTLEKIRHYISENTRAFESRGKIFSGENKVTEKALGAVADELLDKLHVKEKQEEKTSYAWLYYSGGVLAVALFVFLLLRRSSTGPPH